MHHYRRALLVFSFLLALLVLPTPASQAACGICNGGPQATLTSDQFIPMIIPGTHQERLNNARLADRSGELVDLTLVE